MTAGPYSIGSDTWPGLAKLMEEAAEVIQIGGKIIAAGGSTHHWDGAVPALNTRLEDELGDLLASVEFLLAHNTRLNGTRIRERREHKVSLFDVWHREA